MTAAATPWEILLIEDSDRDVRLIRGMLCDRPRFTLTHAPTLAGGIALVRRGPCAAVLLDLTLPDSDGIETLVAMRGAAAAAIVVLTGTDDDLLAAEIARLGGQGYLVKGDFSAGVLVRTIEFACERARVEGERDRLHREVQTVLDHLPGIAFMKDSESRYVRVNRHFTAYRGCGPEAIVGRGDRELYPADLAEEILAEDRRIFETGEPLKVEHRSKITDRVFEIVKVPLKDRGGAAAGIVGMGFEITGRVKAAEALRLSEEHFRALTENSSDIILVMNKKGCFTYCSSSIEHHLGYKPEELIGRSGAELILPDDIPRAVCDFKAAKRSSIGAIPNGFRVLHKDGAVRVLEGLGRNLFDNPAVAGFVMNVRDITERKRAEEERIKLQEQLEHARKLDAIGQLAGGVAHDFNNILSVILTSAGFLLDDLPADSPLRADAAEIRDSAGRAAALTRQLLAFSRKERTSPRVVVVDDAVRGIVSMLGRLIGEHVRLELDLAARGARIRIDPTQLEQIIINLSVNARDAMQGGGTITIGTSAAEGGRVCISVIDTGTGMPPEVVGRIFEPFFTTKPVGKGTGLGLSTVYGAVQQNLGQIEVASEPGKGTTFRISFAQVEPGTPRS